MNKLTAAQQAWDNATQPDDMGEYDCEAGEHVWITERVTRTGAAYRCEACGKIDADVWGD